MVAIRVMKDLGKALHFIGKEPRLKGVSALPRPLSTGH